MQPILVLAAYAVEFRTGKPWSGESWEGNRWSGSPWNGDAWEGNTSGNRQPGDPTNPGGPNNPNNPRAPVSPNDPSKPENSGSGAGDDPTNNSSEKDDNEHFCETQPYEIGKYVAQDIVGGRSRKAGYLRTITINSSANDNIVEGLIALWHEFQSFFDTVKKNGFYE